MKIILITIFFTLVAEITIVLVAVVIDDHFFSKPRYKRYEIMRKAENQYFAEALIRINQQTQVNLTDEELSKIRYWDSKEKTIQLSICQKIAGKAEILKLIDEANEQWNTKVKEITD